ncbi:MAG: sulfite exporter TauE/SafE family protein [Ktedonobacteraceae bacterium]|nr:sulfite exporter TauE/SafE family protein [Ktedonobacteraceae bacterium]
MESLTLLQQVLVVVSGVLVGFTLGLIGGGGSILAVPLLLYFVGYHDPHVVIGTTAVAVAATAYINLMPHWRAGNVRWKPALLFALPGAIGAAIGAEIGKVFPGKPLLFLFALLMVGIAISMLRQQKTEAKPVRSGWSLLLWTVPISFLVGLLSGFFGIGGGFLIVPGLMFATGMPLLNAIGSSLFSVGVFGTVTAITYALSHLVNWLVVVEYIIGGVLGGILGARLALYLGKQKHLLARIFAIIILVVAAYMLYVNFSAIFHL